MALLRTRTRLVFKVGDQLGSFSQRSKIDPVAIR
jgi:hypothetical protein